MIIENELIAPLFRFCGHRSLESHVFNADHIHSASITDGSKLNIVVYDDEGRYEYGIGYPTAKQAKAKCAEFIKLWNKNLTRVK